ncbi:hypothetical protein LWI29_004573 [Acer saccharum]|uniref:DUF629 domain-containing protein n=1 Tax=Acer saccharum TaxID=4024 RepID=A0AA39SWD3_ACESA|nr:hypothetical protein LWI29_004573 [Acer saccharum]
MFFEKLWNDLPNKSEYYPVSVRDIKNNLEDIHEKKLKALFKSAIDCKKEYNTWNIWVCISCTEEKFFNDRKKLRDHYIDQHFFLKEYFGNLEEVQENEVQENEVQEITLGGGDSDLSFQIGKFYNTISFDSFENVLTANENKGKKGKKKKKKSSQVSVAESAEEALATDLDEHLDSIQLLSALFSPYIQDAGLGEDNIDGGWLGRQGIAVALHEVANVLRKEDLPIVMTFLISHALGKFYNTISFDSFENVLTANENKGKKGKKKKKKSSQVSVAESAEEALATDLDEHLDSIQGKFYNTNSFDSFENVLTANENKGKKGKKKKKKSSQVSVAESAKETLATDLDEHLDSIQLLSALFSPYIQDAGLGEDNIDGGWLGRQGIAVALHEVTNVLRKEDLPIVMTFLISHALGKFYNTNSFDSFENVLTANENKGKKGKKKKKKSSQVSVAESAEEALALIWMNT